LLANRKVIEVAGLPSAVTESIALWDDFLMQGYVDQRRCETGYDVEQISDKQYTALLQLVDSYFARGYEYFTPDILRAADLQRLEMRYRNRSSAR
ncbi:MAG: hypothetical protein WD995_08675, partial [Gemmatimonadota bacterium]